jgi:phosphoglycolate phosphatase
MTHCKIGLAIFDLDGTLIDSVGDIAAAVNLMLGELDQAPLAQDEVRAMVGDGAASLVDRVLASRPAAAIDASAALKRYLALYDANPLGLTQLYPGVAETLALLQQRGLRLALCTNKPEQPSRRILDSFGLAGVFERIIGGDTLPWRKPDARVLKAIIAELGATPEATILVGDSEVDAASAAASGIPFILMSYGYRRGPVETIACQAALDRFDALADLLVDRFQSSEPIAQRPAPSPNPLPRGERAL